MEPSADQSRPSLFDSIADDIVGEEIAKPVIVKSPIQPTVTEEEEHSATGHVVYRNWCRICVGTKGHGQPHLTQPDDDVSVVPRVVCDYGFMGQDDGKCLPILVIKDKRSKKYGS
jgi:hypothetical protein